MRLEELHEKRKAGFQIEKSIQREKEFTNLLESSFIAKDNFLALIERVEEVAQLFSIQLTTNSALLKDDPQNPLLAMNVTLRGKFSDLRGALAAIEDFPYWISVETMKWENLNTPDASSLELTFTILTKL